MLIYGILMLIVGAFIYRKLAKLNQEMEVEKDEEIKKALAKSARKRKLTANILIGLGAIITLVSIILLISI